MAKKMRKLLTALLVLTLVVSLLAIPVSADFAGNRNKRPNYPSYPGNPWFPGGNMEQYEEQEWYEVYLQGTKIAEGTGEAGDYYYLGTHYVTDIVIDGSDLTWIITPQGVFNAKSFQDTVNLTDYIDIPEGYAVTEFTIEEFSVSGINDPNVDMFDNAVLTIVITKITHEDTGEEIELPPVEPPYPTEPSEDPTEPSEDPTEPSEDPTEPSEEPTEPSEDPTEPSEDPSEPSEDPTEPSGDPTEPSEDPTEPVNTDPTDPSGDSTEPSGDGGDPVPLDDVVPIAAVPQTSDPSLLWTGASLLSAAGLALLNRKKKED